MKEIDLKHDLFGNIRSFTENDQIYFVASDVAKALGYSTPQKAIYDHCQENVQINGTPNRNTLNLKDANGRPHDYRIIDEPNLYRLIFGSTIESAKDFTEWVFTEVLPSIRKYGAYPKPENANEPKQLEQKVAGLQAKLESSNERLKSVQDAIQKSIANPEASMSMHKHDLLMSWVDLGWLEYRYKMVPRHTYKITDMGKDFLYRPKGSKAIRLIDNPGEMN